MKRAASSLAIAIGLTACAVPIPDGRLRCDEAEPCPPTYSCVAGLCYAPGFDAGTLDATDDAPADDASDDAPPPLPPVIRSVSGGLAHTCAIDTNGRSYCWGRDAEGQIGNSPAFDALAVTRPERVVGLDDVTIEAVELGDAFTCALDEGVAVYCWGSDRFGQLGSAATGDSGSPVPNRVDGLVAPIAIAAGAEHACAVERDGDVLCWGRGERGQNGDPGRMVRNTPTLVLLPGTTRAISAGTTHTCALSMAGALHCWGDNARSQLAAALPLFSATPVLVDLPGPVARIEAFAASSCAISDGGGVSCWGWNDSAELGNGAAPPATRAEPMPVPLADGTLRGFDGGGADVAFGGAHACAVVDATLYCWGRAASGELGDGRNGFVAPQAEVDVPVPLTDVSAVGTGVFHTCAIARDELYCWGRNDGGQLGNATTMDTNEPLAPIPFPF